jgi:hypothetical protein
MKQIVSEERRRLAPVALTVAFCVLWAGAAWAAASRPEGRARAGGPIFLSWFVCSVVASWLVAVFLPRALSRSIVAMAKNFWGNLGRGLLFGIVIAILAVGLLIPGGIALAGLGSAIALFGYVTAATTLGAWVRRRGSLVGRAVVGSLLLGLTAAIPILGWAFWLVMLLWGMGATFAAAVEAANRNSPPTEGPEPASAEHA